MKNNAGGASASTLRKPSREPGKSATDTELEKARAETTRVLAEAVAAREKEEQLRAGMLKASRNNKLRLRTTAVIMMTAALLKLVGKPRMHKRPFPLLEPLSV